MWQQPEGRSDDLDLTLSNNGRWRTGVSIAGAMAQQDNQSMTGGSALKSTTPGNPNDARSAATASTGSGGSALKETTVGDTGKKVVPEPHSTPTARQADSQQK